MSMFRARLRHCQRRSPAAAKVPSGPIHSRHWAEDSAVRAQPPVSRRDASSSLNEGIPHHDTSVEPSVSEVLGDDLGQAEDLRVGPQVRVEP